MQTQDDNGGPTPDILRTLLRGEMSAVETYERALEKVNGSPEGAKLRQIFADHSQAVGLLRDLLIRYEGQLPMSSGAWGTFANAVQATANLLGDSAALKALKEGEEHGIKEYQRALEEPGVSPDVKGLSRSLLSRCQSHVPVLDAMLERQ
jgi:hypothetical protein